MTKTTKSKNEEINLEELKAKLKRGHFSKIAQKLNVKPQTISNQFRGKTKVVKDSVIVAALEVLSEEKKNKIELNKQIKSV
jgi:hypothetical protein